MQTSTLDFFFSDYVRSIRAQCCSAEVNYYLGSGHAIIYAWPTPLITRPRRCCRTQIGRTVPSGASNPLETLLLLLLSFPQQLNNGHPFLSAITSTVLLQPAVLLIPLVLNLVHTLFIFSFAVYIISFCDLLLENGLALPNIRHNLFNQISQCFYATRRNVFFHWRLRSL